ncbi:MAG: carotenoid oxygenase family protein [Microcystaceae cyanobacterium]
MKTIIYPKWAGALRTPSQEFPVTSLTIERGVIPTDLEASIFFNGPARLERNGQKVGHWFDGDGAVLGIHFNKGEAQGSYRYVQTKAYQEETKANHFLYGNYGSPPPPPFWNKIFRPIKDTANTSVLALDDKVLALQEACLPYSLDPLTLETQGIERLNGLKHPYSAHPKQDRLSNRIYNFGIGLGLNATLHLYEQDLKGKLLKSKSFPLNGFPLIHDFCLAGEYLIFLVAPVLCDIWQALSGKSSFSDSLKWQPKQGTKLLIFDRNLELVSQGETDAFFSWHYGNGWVEHDGNVYLDLVQYPDFYQTNRHLKEIPCGQTTTPYQSALVQLKIEPNQGKVVDQITLLDRCCEFPKVDPAQVAYKHSNIYFCIHQEGTNTVTERYNALACYNYETQQLSTTNFEPHWYPSEPIFIPQPKNQGGWIISVIYDGNSETSKMVILDAEKLENEPLAILDLPTRMPLFFHGCCKI